MALVISVIIPAYNAQAYLGEAIDSVLAQTRAADEVLVVNDGSTDNSAEVAASFGARVQVISQAHAGTAAARNAGLARAHGEVIALLDADDVWLPDKLARQMDCLEADAELELVYGHMQEFFSPELDEGERAKLVLHSEPQPSRLPSAMLARRRAFERVGLFDNGLSLSEAVDWQLRAHEAGLREHMLPELVARRRIHAGNKGRLLRDRRVDYVRAVRAALVRRRAQGEQK